MKQYKQKTLYSLHQIKDCDPVTNGREQRSPVRAEEEIALAVDRAKQVGELEVGLHCSYTAMPDAGRTLGTVVWVPAQDWCDSERETVLIELELSPDLARTRDCECARDAIDPRDVRRRTVAAREAARDA